MSLQVNGNQIQYHKPLTKEIEDEILFPIKTVHLETGMRGFPVGYAVTSFVDPQKGVFYRGHSILELADKSPEDVMYLLFQSSFANEKQIKEFTSKILLKKTPIWLSDIVKSLPRSKNLMSALSALLNICGMTETTHDWKKDGFNLIAIMPLLIGTLVRQYAQITTNIPDSKSKKFVESFVNMLGVTDPKNRAQMISALKIFCVLHFDHGGGNLSTFVGKAVASGGCNIYSAMACAMTALSGPLHGGANKDSIEFIESIQSTFKDSPTEKQISDYVQNKLKNKEKIPGFGHAVLRKEDPRATVLYDYAQKMFPHNKSVQIALTLRKVVPRVLKQYPKIQNPYPNVDAISGVVLKASGLVSYPEFLPLYFALARCVGITRQIIYERCEARDGKGTPIVRPKYVYREPNK